MSYRNLSGREVALLLLAAACLAVAGCRSDGGVAAASCESDAECTAPGTRCDVANKRCICATSEACSDGHFCNRAGVCQALSGCTRSADCVEGSYCDIGTGRCLAGPPLMVGSACGLASHCPYNHVCEDGTCVMGCYDDGDCRLGEACFDGLCSAGVCSNAGFCKYGELCRNNLCGRDNRGPYCRGCTFRTAQNPNPCDDRRNFCLVNSLELGGFTQFCGVDCSLGQGCPNGYDCRGVVILTEQVCTFTAECRCDRNRITFPDTVCALQQVCDPRLPNGAPDPNASACVAAGHPTCNGGVQGGAASCIVTRGQQEGFCTCGTDDDCGEGGSCIGGACCSGRIRDDRQCAVGESRVSGFCTCGTDDDCPRDVCEGGRCAITGLPCTPGQDDCGPIPCVNGGCLIGRNCAPLEGLSCSVVRGQ